MTAPKKKAKRTKARLPLAGLTVIAALFALNLAVALTVLSPKQYDIAVGDIASETIFAARTVEDTATTDALRQAARNAVQTIYATDEASAQKLLTDAKTFFTVLERIRTEAAAERLDTAPTQTDADGNVTPAEDTRSWEAVYPGDNVKLLFQDLPISISDTAMLYSILSASDEDVTRLKDTVLSKLEVTLYEGVTESGIASKRQSISKELQITTIPVYLKSLGEKVYDAYFKATNVEDATNMRAAREKAASQVEPVYISRGTAIVEKGDVVSAEQMQLLLALDLVRGVDENKLFVPGVSLYLFVLYLLYAVYLLAFVKDVIGSGKRMLFVLISVGITIALEWVCYLLDPRLSPAMLAVILTAALIHPQFAQSVNILLAFSLGILAGGSGTGLVGSDALIAIAASVVSGEAAILTIRGSSKRGALITAGVLAAVAGSVIVLAGAMLRGTDWRTIAVFIGCTAASPIILAVFAVGMLSIWENAFDIVTQPRLHELMNANHPLLKRMMTAAPGTYHHSMTAAALAEGAAEAIGANALLARAGAAFHDVGKLRRPNYFTENQSGKNIHDTLPPEESAEIIIAHQQDAEQLLSRYHIPSAIRQIAYEHHGTSLVAYFYYKAKKAAENPDTVNEKLYRYPGTEPTTKESAIVMLADSCEAAVRSLSEPSREEVAEMIHKVVRGKLDDGQLRNAPLTMAELTRIEKSFLITITGLLHERIRYPSGEEKE